MSYSFDYGNFLILNGERDPGQEYHNKHRKDKHQAEYMSHIQIPSIIYNNIYLKLLLM